MTWRYKIVDDRSVVARGSADKDVELYRSQSRKLNKTKCAFFGDGLRATVGNESYQLPCTSLIISLPLVQTSKLNFNHAFYQIVLGISYYGPGLQHATGSQCI